MSQGAEAQKAALWRAFRIVHDLQAGVPGTLAALEGLSRAAGEHGWGDVERAVLYARAIHAWFSGAEDVPLTVEALIDRSSADGDDVMLAMALAMRSDPGFAHSDRLGVASRDGDLARAVVLLESGEGHPLERISAHTACGIAFCNRWVFELGDEQYAAGLAAGVGEPRGALDFILAPIMFNRAEIQVMWASWLRQLGDHEGVAERWKTWKSLADEAEDSYAMVDAWRVELRALGLVLAATAGEDAAAPASALLATMRSSTDAPRATGLLNLAVALSDADAGRSTTASLRSALATLDPVAHPHAYTLALGLAAEVEARDGRRAGLVYARRHLEEHWADRRSSLGAMRARIAAERLARERDVLTRHARLDDLTGVGNRRALTQYLAELNFEEVTRLALILLDVNAFKLFNDRYGHLAGDAVLLRVAQVLQRHVRSRDLVVRLGGDEFVVVLPEVDLDAACTRATRVLMQMEDERFPDISADLVVGLSAGAAAGGQADVRAIFAAADAALYRAKAGGGTRVGRSVMARAEP
jgi:diguanylate cyclase (GGDEF)-like protein